MLWLYWSSTKNKTFSSPTVADTSKMSDENWRIMAAQSTTIASKVVSNFLACKLLQQQSIPRICRPTFRTTDVVWHTTFESKNDFRSLFSAAFWKLATVCTQYGRLIYMAKSIGRFTTIWLRYPTRCLPRPFCGYVLKRGPMYLKTARIGCIIRVIWELE